MAAVRAVAGAPARRPGLRARRVSLHAAADGRLSDRGRILSRQAHQQNRERPDIEPGEVQACKVIRHRPQPRDPFLGQTRVGISRTRFGRVARDIVVAVNVVQQLPALLGLLGLVQKIPAPPVREQLPAGADQFVSLGQEPAPKI